MLNLSINDPIVENFYYRDCNKDTKTFIEKVSHFIEINKIRKTVNTAFNELEDVKNGNLKAIPMEELLKDLND